jgi:hypothetical protein
VAEYADCSYAVEVDAAGAITSRPRAVEAFSAQDMLNKVGGFDETLGEFGGSMGNGFCALRNKRFSRLILCPVDIVTPASGTAYGCRFWRELPTNTSATNAAPVVPVTGAVVSASREFRNAGDRVRVASRFAFTDDVAFHSGTDGVWLTSASAATQVFESASADWDTSDVQVGDILVAGVIGASGVQGSMAGTYRITAITDQDTIVVQKLDGTNFASTAGTAIAWRVHPAAAADTAGSVAGVHVALSGASGAVVPCRPLDATVAAGAVLTPATVPSAATANSWDPLSGLGGATHPTGALTYDANVHAPNAAANSTLDARYQAAIDALMTDDYPARDINIGYCSRRSTVIRAKCKAHVLAASERGLTRRWIIGPDIDVTSVDTVTADADPGVGANRSERIDYAWPGAITSVPEAVGYTLATADGGTTDEGLLDDPSDGWLASVESNLPPERNPGQAAPPVPTVMAPVLGFQRGVENLSMNQYMVLRQRGVCALRMDKTAGPIFQSGITSSLVSGEKNIARRRMADFIQDSISQRMVQFSKLPLTQQLKDTAYGELDAFLFDLQSPNNPAASRIAAYEIDDVSGNTPDLEASGVFVIIVRVRLTPTADFIVLQTEIGEGVEITDAA